MKELSHLLTHFTDKQAKLAELLITREYTNEALLYIPNLARTLNIYKEYKPNLSVLPERPKKTKFTFVELVWIKMVFDLRKFGLDFDAIRELKDFLFKSFQDETILIEIGKKGDEIANILKDILPAGETYSSQQLTKILTANLNSQKLTLSFLLTIIINCVFKKMPIDFRIYLNGRIELHSEVPDGEFIKKVKDPDLINKSFISISLTEIISFYLGEPFINPSLASNMFSDDQLFILETIKNEKPKSITVEFGKDNKIDLIKVKKEININVTQRLSEILLDNGYSEIKVVTQKGKIAYCTREKKIKP